MFGLIQLGRGLLVALLLLPPAAGAATLNGFDLDDASIPADEIRAGGPPRDGIPAIDAPRFVGAAEARFLTPHSRVIGVAINGDARAYPIAILNWHEVVNDRLGDTNLVVTYCPLCGTGVVYRAEQDQRLLSFGVSGLLYNSDVLLYDRETESLWSQLLHGAISGPLKGAELVQLPSLLTSWSDWQRRYPATRVLSTDTGYRRNYERNPYGGYDESLALYFPVAFLSQQFHPKERVLGVERAGVARAYPFSELAKLGNIGELSDQLGDEVVRIRYDAEARSAELLDAGGQPLAAINAFWFAWYTFHPDTEVYRAPRSDDAR
ncbi:DUF3179 domain-containing protein [Motiliproteus sediminis]|uniref:DUF3179 domain-containing protein n=1 Tax=Motiliproteus sediminis TaxID=1468178 RepID=UPI001AEFA29A|nr:DUF3179 domain-containing protein [Motiliproteus sediminis]